MLEAWLVLQPRTDGHSVYDTQRLLSTESSHSLGHQEAPSSDSHMRATAEHNLKTKQCPHTQTRPHLHTTPWPFMGRGTIITVGNLFGPFFIFVAGLFTERRPSEPCRWPVCLRRCRLVADATPTRLPVGWTFWLVYEWWPSSAHMETCYIFPLTYLNRREFSVPKKQAHRIL